ncbi:MAG: histidine kinase [Candidatus Villigracilaceae bacterium]
MRKFETPYVVDWFSITLRWLALVGLAIGLGSGSQFTGILLLPLGALTAWNLTMSFLGGLNRRMAYHRLINVAIDLTLTGIIFWLQGGLSGPVGWFCFLPILTGALYFEFSGAFAVAAILTLLQIVSQQVMPAALPFWMVTGIVVGGNALLAAGAGYLSHRLMNRLRHDRQIWLETEERKRRVETERLRAIYDLTSTLISTLDYRRVLDSALDLAATALKTDPDLEMDERLVGAVLLFSGSELHVGSARRFTAADMRVTLPATEGLLARTIESSEPMLSTNVGFDPELSRIVALHTCTAAYCFPLRSGFNVYGVMLFAHPEANFFTQDRREMLDIVGRQALIAIQNSRLYQDLIEEKERMIEVHEEARKKLARDLHDGPTQSVSAIAMRINIARRMLQKDAQSASDELVRIEELAQRTTKEIRHMLFTLRPLVLESQGLVAALTTMAEKMRETFNQNVTINVDESLLEQLEMGKQGVIFYIVEEAVNNARKHARAETIAVSLKRLDPALILLEIADNGIGFDVQAINAAYDKRGSLGMVNLRERTELVNGLLHIDSAPGKGTRVQVFIPLTDEAADRLHHGRS